MRTKLFKKTIKAIALAATLTACDPYDPLTKVEESYSQQVCDENLCEVVSTLESGRSQIQEFHGTTYKLYNRAMIQQHDNPIQIQLEIVNGSLVNERRKRFEVPTTLLEKGKCAQVDSNMSIMALDASFYKPTKEILAERSKLEYCLFQP